MKFRVLRVVAINVTVFWNVNLKMKAREEVITASRYSDLSSLL
jgi:hypothetical protein